MPAAANTVIASAWSPSKPRVELVSRASHDKDAKRIQSEIIVPESNEKTDSRRNSDRGNFMGGDFVERRIFIDMQLKAVYPGQLVVGCLKSVIRTQRIVGFS